jgi:hypothetical protein
VLATREKTASPADDFARRVLAALPPAAATSAQRERRRSWIIAAGAIAGGCLAWLLGGDAVLVLLTRCSAGMCALAGAFLAPHGPCASLLAAAASSLVALTAWWVWHRRPWPG